MYTQKFQLDVVIPEGAYQFQTIQWDSFLFM